ncbi:imm11 family protein [Aquimarina algicola]|uniref:Immunity MXAN-0049 protein domain-containing protein n=1 Tax=Aquimarina algicola TaxID=2589995 RepID=A0A504JJ93_9FLAO|nr:DUF1629 domain-containing protein [Aquimarina algicola]TPN86819.1 hypothetical protein FHK87_04230 [Aquimarina algicola]
MRLIGNIRFTKEQVTMIDEKFNIIKDRMKYWVIKFYGPSDAVFLSGLSSKMPESFKFDKGISLINEYPSVEDCKIYYDPQYPEGIQLYNFLDNINDLLIVNSEVKEVFEDLGVDSIEYLPIWLCDHNHEVSSKDYFICNVLSKIDIFDMEESEYDMSSLDESQIADVDNMIVDYDAVPKDAKVFRASKMLNQIFINDNVKQALEKAGFEGFFVKEAEGWNGI